MIVLIEEQIPTSNELALTTATNNTSLGATSLVVESREEKQNRLKKEEAERIRQAELSRHQSVISSNSIHYCNPKKRLR